MIKLMISGSRSITDASFVFKAIDEYVESIGGNVIILEGEARGVDALSKVWAADHEKPIMAFPAKWDLYGKSAGYKRNLEMFKECDHCLIIWDGESNGSKHVKLLCEEFNKPHKVVIHSKES